MVRVAYFSEQFFIQTSHFTINSNNTSRLNTDLFVIFQWFKNKVFKSISVEKKQMKDWPLWK